MAKYYYSDVLLPELPVSSYTYPFIRKNNSAGNYDLIFGEKIPFVAQNGTTVFFGADNYGNYEWYTIPIATAETATEWTFVERGSTSFGLDANRTLFWTLHDMPKDGYNSSTIYMAGSEPVPEAPEEPEEPEAEYAERYSILGSILVGTARQIMRLTDSTAKVKPEEFETKLEGVEAGIALPYAEEYAFGVVNTAHEFGVLGWGDRLSTDYNRKGGYKFTPKKNLTVSGVWAKAYEDNSWAYYAGIWAEDGTVLASGKIDCKKAGAYLWFDTAIILEAGKTYVVAASIARAEMYDASQMSFNPDIEYKNAVSSSSMDTGSIGGCPPDFSSSSVVAADIVIVPTAEPQPEEYAISLETMNDIADEIIRITGGTQQVTTAQILAVLQGISAS
jgi:hypothetical protein